MYLEDIIQKFLTFHFKANTYSLNITVSNCQHLTIFKIKMVISYVWFISINIIVPPFLGTWWHTILFLTWLFYLNIKYMTTEKTIALTRPTFVGKIMSLFLNMLSRLVITFLPRSKCLLISWLQSPSAVILEPPQNKVWYCFPIYFPWSGGTRCHDLSFLNVEL